MKCIRCKAKAVIHLPQHRAAFCRPCYLEYFERQVERAINSEGMLTRTDRVLVAVSGGKDSLALWDVLIRLGYQTGGLHIDLGIGEYSKRSKEKVENFAARHQLPLRIVEIKEEAGGTVPQLAEWSHRNPCSACGTVKRHLFNLTAYVEGFDVVATGHNLDDEAARLLGNTLNWQMDMLARQGPVLKAVGEKLIKKVKPLFRLSEKETAAYAILRGIDYIVEECPNAEGATSLVYKAVLNQLENSSPGSKLRFYLGFLERMKGLIEDSGKEQLKGCIKCGQLTTSEICAYCRLVELGRTL